MMETTEARLYDWLAMAGQRLRDSGVSEPDKTARYLAAHALQQDASWVLTHGEFAFPFEALEPLLQRAENHEPLAYIRGYAYFDDYAFTVRSGVLIPRPETHHVVEAALEWLGQKTSRCTCLDLCCGSGCIGITLALKTAHKWTLSDLYDRVIQVAQLNQDRLGATVEVVKSDLVKSFEDARFDLICTNPPYIIEGEELARVIRDHEPEEALYAGPDGLASYRRVAAETPRVLKENGVLITEIGAGQAQEVQAIFESNGWVHERTILDLAGIERVLQFRHRSQAGSGFSTTNS